MENHHVFTRRAFSMSAAAALLAGGDIARAQSTFATQNIRLVVGYPAGGGVDIVARLLTEPMKAAFGQAVLVENKPGAAAMIAAQSVARATPDGHTLLVSASGEVALNQHIYRERMNYDPLKDLTPVALAGIVPCVVVVAATTPVKTPAELIAYALANKGKLSFSSSGVGNPQHLAGELMNRMAGTDVLHVPYRGSAPAVTDVAVGAVTMSFSSLGAALPLLQDGRLRAVAVTSARADAATARRGAAERGLAGAGRLRTAELVRRVRAVGHAGAAADAAVRSDLGRAAGQGDDGEAPDPGHRAAAADAGRLARLRAIGEREIRQGGRGRQDPRRVKRYDRVASTTPASVNSSATICTGPSGSPSAIADATTPMTGTAMVPIAATDAGSRASAANQQT